MSELQRLRCHKCAMTLAIFVSEPFVLEVMMSRVARVRMKDERLLLKCAQCRKWVVWDLD